MYVTESIIEMDIIEITKKTAPPKYRMKLHLSLEQGRELLNASVILEPTTKIILLTFLPLGFTDMNIYTDN